MLCFRCILLPVTAPCELLLKTEVATMGALQWRQTKSNCGMNNQIYKTSSYYTSLLIFFAHETLTI